MKKRLLAATAIAALTVFVSTTDAADVIEAPAESIFYVSLFGGASFLEDVDTNYDGNGEEYSVETKTGYIVGGAIGARIWDPLRAEIELSYSRWNGDEYSSSGGDSGSVDGHIEAAYLLGNLWFDLNMDSAFTPYVGGGAGIAFVDAEIGRA